MLSTMQAINRVTDMEARDVLLRLAAEHAQFKGRLIATAGVPCVKDASWKRHPMKCFPKDPCSFCRAREALRGVDETPDEEAPIVCPGCHSVGDEPCAPGCIDDEMAREREESTYGDVDDGEE